jgi:putative nucleotidyltransferase with HDIG domain
MPRLGLRRVSWTIMVPFATLSLGAGFLGSYFVTATATAPLEERFQNRLSEASRSAADSVVRRERQQLALLRSLAFTDGMAEAAAAGRAGEVTELALPLAANAGADLVEVVDLSGRPVVSLVLADRAALRYEVLPGEPSRTSWAAVRRVLAGEADTRGDRFAGIEQGPRGAALYSVGPLRAGERLVGAVLVGTRVEQLATVMKAEALADVMLYDAAGTTLGSTAEPVEGEPAAVALPAGTRRQQLAGRDFELLGAELRVRDEVAGSYVVALPAQFIAAASARTRETLTLLFTGGTLAVLVIGWLVARRLTRPLSALLQATGAVMGGDLSARSGVRRVDEIGALATSFDAMAATLERQHLGTLEALVSAIDARDAYTRGHSARVGHLARALGRELGVSERDSQHLLVGGFLHDIGKIGVRDAVLLKPGMLTAEERAQIEQHPRIGLAILEPVGLPTEVIAGVGGHHERLDGSGYPLGLAGDAVSRYPRVITVADVYDALITDRPYRAALPLVKVLELLERDLATGKIDGDVLAALRRVAPAWEQRRREDPMLRGFALESSGMRAFGARQASRRVA